MTKTDRIPKPWGAFLRDLDDIATAAVDFHCIGGFVVNMKFGFSSRQTFDIDVLAITPNTQRQEFLQNAAKGSVLHRKHGVYLDLVTVIQAYPEDYDQRLTEIYSGQLKKIRLFAVEPHDLALMKLERNAERDRVDVMFLASQGLVTASELERRYRAEMRSYIGVPERSTDITLQLWVSMMKEEALARDSDSK
jgi:Nucleotidyltransferase of unknown function (DUF6036)